MSSENTTVLVSDDRYTIRAKLESDKYLFLHCVVDEELFCKGTLKDIRKDFEDILFGVKDAGYDYAYTQTENERFIKALNVPYENVMETDGGLKVVAWVLN